MLSLIFSGNAKANIVMLEESNNRLQAPLKGESWGILLALYFVQMPIPQILLWRSLGIA
jgi:hypothetical protein